jgi:hypothetical protein
VLCGHQAAKALDKYIKKLEKRRASNLTEKQAEALLKTAKVLRVAVVQTSS